MISQLHKDFNPIVSPLWSCTYYSLTNVKARSLCGLVLTGPAEGLKIGWANIIGRLFEGTYFADPCHEQNLGGRGANWPPNLAARFRRPCLMLKADNLFHALVPIRSARQALL